MNKLHQFRNLFKAKPLTYNEQRCVFVSVTVVVLGYNNAQLSIALVNAGSEANTNKWTLPGRYLSSNEHLEEVCLELVKSATDVNDPYVEQICSIDNFSQERETKTISVAYIAYLNQENMITVQKNGTKILKWHSLTAMPTLESEQKMLVTLAIHHLRHGIQFSPICFKLLNPTFTMTELRLLFEIVLKIEIDRRNFRKRLINGGYIQYLGVKRGGNTQQFPQLFRFNNNFDLKNFCLKF